MQPASEATKQALLDTITAKSEGGHDYGTGVHKELILDAPERSELSVARIREGLNTTDPNRVAQIHRVEWPGKLYGEQLITNYFIVKSPDGLQMEKHSLTFGPNVMLDRNASRENKINAATNGLAELAAIEKAQAAENELGLSFVSEAEAKSLLALIERAQPAQ